MFPGDTERKKNLNGRKWQPQSWKNIILEIKILCIGSRHKWRGLSEAKFGTLFDGVLDECRYITYDSYNRKVMELSVKKTLHY